MPKQAYYWQLYISTYTALLGLPLLFFPKAVIPLMGFALPWRTKARSCG